MCGSFSSPGFLVERLILPQADTVDAKQLGGHTGQTRMTRQRSQSHALNKTLFVSVFFRHRAVVCGGSDCHLGINRAGILAKLLQAEYIRGFHKAILLKTCDGLCVQCDGVLMLAHNLKAL